MKTILVICLLLSVPAFTQDTSVRADRPSRPTPNLEENAEQAETQLRGPELTRPDISLPERGSPVESDEAKQRFSDINISESNGLDPNDQKLKKLAYSEVTSFKVSRDTQQCTVVLAQNIKRQPFDLTLKRSAAIFDAKATEVNQATLEAGSREARAILSQEGDPQINAYRAQAATDVASQAVTVRSKFWNKITQIMYGTASLNSYLKDLQIGRYRKSCHSKIFELSPSDCSGKASDIVKKLILKDVFLGKVDARDKENRYKQMMEGLKLSKSCGDKKLYKKCKKYLREVEEDLAFCKESLPSSMNSSFIDFLNDLIHETVFIQEAYAGSREGRFGTYGDSILTHIESDPLANSQNFITDPFNRGSLSYSLNKAKKNGSPGLEHLQRVQQDNIEEVESLTNSLTNGDNLILTEAIEPLRNAGEFNASLNISLASLAGLDQSSFSGVNEFKKVKSSDPSTEFAILGDQEAKVNGMVKELSTVLNDFDTGKAFTAESYKRQEELVKNLPYLEKLLEKVKAAAEKGRSDLIRNGKKGYQERDFSKDMIAALKRSGLSERDMVVGIIPSANGGLGKTVDKTDSSKKETVIEKTETITITSGNDLGDKSKEDEEDIRGIVTDATNFDILTERQIAEMNTISIQNADINTKKGASIFQIISNRYLKVAPRRLSLVPMSVNERFKID